MPCMEKEAGNTLEIYFMSTAQEGMGSIAGAKAAAGGEPALLGLGG